MVEKMANRDPTGVESVSAEQALELGREAWTDRRIEVDTPLFPESQERRCHGRTPPSAIVEYSAVARAPRPLDLRRSLRLRSRAPPIAESTSVRSLSRTRKYQAPALLNCPVQMPAAWAKVSSSGSCKPSNSNKPVPEEGPAQRRGSRRIRSTQALFLKVNFPDQFATTSVRH